MRALLTLLGVLLIVIWLELGYKYQGPQMLMAQLICLVVIVLICLAMYFIIGWAFRQYIIHKIPSGRMTGDRPSRRNMSALMKTDEEKHLEAMDEDGLMRLIEKHPRYALAVEVLCERLKASGQWSEYTRQMQYMLSIPNDLSIEEVCNRYYELADVYNTRLGRTDRAEEMIRAIIATFPGHYEATEARRRLATLNQQTDTIPDKT